MAKEFLKQFSKDQNYDTQNRSFKDETTLGVEFNKANDYYLAGTSDNTSGENYDSRAVANGLYFG